MSNQEKEYTTEEILTLYPEIEEYYRNSIKSRIFLYLLPTILIIVLAILGIKPWQLVIAAIVFFLPLKLLIGKRKGQLSELLKFEKRIVEKKEFREIPEPIFFGSVSRKFEFDKTPYSPYLLLLKASEELGREQEWVYISSLAFDEIKSGDSVYVPIEKQRNLMFGKFALPDPDSEIGNKYRKMQQSKEKAKSL